MKRLSFRRINHKFSTVSTKSVGNKVFSSSMSVNVMPKCGQMKGSVVSSSWLFMLVERLLLMLLVFEFCVRSYLLILITVLRTITQRD